MTNPRMEQVPLGGPVWPTFRDQIIGALARLIRDAGYEPVEMTLPSATGELYAMRGVRVVATFTYMLGVGVCVVQGYPAGAIPGHHEDRFCRFVQQGYPQEAEVWVELLVQAERLLGEAQG